MTYMKQVLQEESIFFAELSEAMIVPKLPKKVKYDKSKNKAFQQHPKAAKLKASIAEAEELLNSKGEYTRSKLNKAWSCILMIIRNLGDFLAGVGYIGGTAIVFGSFSFIVSYAITIVSLILSACVIRYIADKGEIRNERNNALKVLSELKKLENKVPEKEKGRIKEQIKRIEKILNKY